MSKSRRKKSGRFRVWHEKDRAGSPPGILLPSEDSNPTRIDVISTNRDEIVEKDLTDLDDLPGLIEKYELTWINVVGLADTALIAKLGGMLKFHELALEDVLNTNHRAKFEEYPNELFIILRMPTLNDILSSEQLSMFIGEKVVVTFQEIAGDPLNPIRDRLRKQSGRIRERGAGYLGYAIIDAVIDSYFPLLENIGERLVSLEDEIVENPGQEMISRIHNVKSDLIALRRFAWPLRELANSLTRTENPIFSGVTQLYLRDAYDHSIQIIDLVENYREIASGLMDVYLSSVSNKMNEVMKVLTIIATIFIPLTFIVGVYGMNFNTEISPSNMPELNWPFGYIFVWLIMLITGIGMILYFLKLGWIGKGK